MPTLLTFDIRTVSNVFAFVANATGYQNLDVAEADIPLTNLTGVYNGPLSTFYYSFAHRLF